METMTTTTTHQPISHTDDQDVPLRIPAWWEDVDQLVPLDWRQSSGYMQSHAFTPHIGALDIETSHNEDFAWMYLWAFAVDDLLFYGRTVDDLKNFLRRLAARLDLRTDYRLMTYIHNAKYDLSFLRCDISLAGRKKSDFIARTRHQIIQCCMEINYLVRDSAVYSEMPLEMMGIEIGMLKMPDYDYDLIRTPETPMEDKDLMYVARDVHILTTYYRMQLAQYGGDYDTIGDIPATATGRDRRLISQSFTLHDNRSYQHGIRKMIYARQLHTVWTKDTQPSEAQQKALDRDKLTLHELRSAFFGGFCYCSPLHTDREIKRSDLMQVVSADLDSCYAAVMLTEMFPVNRWSPMPTNLYPTDEQTLIKMLKHKERPYKDKAMLIRVKLRGVESRIPDFGFLPSWYRYHIAEKGMKKIHRTSRISKADELEIVLTDVDLLQYVRWYKSKDLQIVSILWTDYGYLPMYIRDVIIMLYARKKIAKAEIKAKRAAGTATYQDEIRYRKIKTMLARMYGVFVQDPVRMIYEWDDDKHIVKGCGQSQPDTAQYSPVLYQWGVWVAAIARKWLLDTCSKIGTKKRQDADGQIGGVWDHSIMYCDTDCIRWLDKGDGKQEILIRHNERIRKIMEKVIEPEVYDRIRSDFGIEIPPDTLIGCGEWDIEVYDSYKQLGIKQYAKIENGVFECTLAGLPKSQTYFAMYYDNQDKMDAFCTNLMIPADYTNLMRTRYVEHPMEADVVDCCGELRHVSSKTSVLLEPTDYRARDDDEDSMQIAVDPDALLQELNKAGMEIDWNLYNTVMGDPAYAVGIHVDHQKMTMIDRISGKELPGYTGDTTGYYDEED